MSFSHAELVKDLQLVRELGLPKIASMKLPALSAAAGAYLPAQLDQPLAVEMLVREAIARLGGGSYGETAMRLFGLALGTRGLGPRQRREKAADALEMSAETFRTRHQKEIVEDVGRRILELLADGRDPGTLTVAIGVVLDRGRVVLVRRRQPEGRLEWQFPAGFVKPGRSPSVTVVDEIGKETGLTCRVERSLGSRVHPITSVLCDYFACRLLHGELVNGDTEENSDAQWVPIISVSRYIDIDMIFPPILTLMGIPETEDG